MAENLVQNGSFEVSIDVGTDGWAPLQAGENAIENWTIIKAPNTPTVEANTIYDIDLIRFVEGESPFWGGSEGLQSVDLNGSPGFGGVEQTIATTIGQKYSVTFDMAGNPQSPDGEKVKQIKVQAQGESEVFTFDTTGKSFEDMGWEQKVWEFTATGEETTIQFLTEVNEAEGINTDALRGPALDNVVVMPIFEFVEIQGTAEDDVIVGDDENLITPVPPEEETDEDDTDETPTNYNMIGDAGDDVLIGQEGNDLLDGGGNDDQLIGRGGNDSLDGGFGNDNLFGGEGNDDLLAGGGNDFLDGGNGDDLLDGGEGDDILTGGSGKDILVGGIGRDILTGGNSPDIFRYNDISEAGDTIIDFVPGLETIEFGAIGFGTDLVVGDLAPEQFVIGSAATDAAQRFIYDDVRGSLFFDEDGSGSAQQVFVASFVDQPLLSSTDIVVI
ncbi:MAG: choice-of-anchor C family protein [Gomphosphaeria aponina SAG 52.96 = DSM 107014]|uniref:Choice-of-anchor C family protein n=1 Tax=Gomphosphaeria aponina SAG 52.96 = DSM 107014 TaxID=1521640 RepID=A0A941JR53_9CHRO|nr:choice-of-anchor C family protein [Gomphosphaeria aponina SAG 52.96 = DSM 107014]